MGDEIPTPWAAFVSGQDDTGQRFKTALAQTSGLKIIEAQLTGEAAAEVEFIARFRIGGATAARLHERSRFVRDAGRWLYVDGDIVG